LQAASDTTTTPQLVQGRLTVSEPGTAYPNPTADATRKDRAAWLDSSGQVQIFGADQVPQGVVPQWKKNGWGVKWVIPVWVWLAGAGGVLLLGVLFLLLWLLFAKRRRERDQQEQYISEADPHPGPQPWATRVPHSSSPRRHNKNSWWEDGQVSTPPASRGATEDRSHGSSWRSPRSNRSSKNNRKQQRVRGEGQLHRSEAWGEDPPELPGAYR
jgi:hypothetical protein